MTDTESNNDSTDVETLQVNGKEYVLDDETDEDEVLDLFFDLKRQTSKLLEWMIKSDIDFALSDEEIEGEESDSYSDDGRDYIQ